MISITRRCVAFFALTLMLIVMGGCNEREDKRNTEEKQIAPQPDFKTRLYMACPKCGAPQRPYRINELKSYYRCSGAPPKFPYHTEYKWQHTMEPEEGKSTDQ